MAAKSTNISTELNMDGCGNHGLLLEGGFLYDLALFNSRPSRGRRRNNRRNGNSRSRIGKGANHEATKSRGNAIGYLYPQVIASNDDGENRNDFDVPNPMVLIESNKTSIVAYLDEGPFIECRNMEYLDGVLSSSKREEKDSKRGAEDVVTDYFERINGVGSFIDVDELVEQAHGVSDDDSYSGDGYDEILQKLGGINLMVASMEYGMKKPGFERNYFKKDKKPTPAMYAQSYTRDDLMLVKDPRSVPGRIKTVAGIPQFWPSEPCRRKRFSKIPWKKRRHQKRKLRRVNLQKINLKLDRMVRDGTRDSSQSQLIGAVKALDLPVCDDKPVKADKCTTKKAVSVGVHSRAGSQTLRNKPSKSLETNSAGKEAKKNKAGKVGSYAAQPLSFIPSGNMEGEIVELSTIKSIAPKDTGHTVKLVPNYVEHSAFEMHTTGFGSKMMAKMGYVEGRGLGKDCQGMAQPIQVFQRPKSLGLGAEVPEAHDEPPAMQSQPKAYYT